MNARHRLGGRGRIAAVRQAGSEARRGPVRVRGVINDCAMSRVAFAVPAAGGAVRRNRARRRLRAAIAPLLDTRPGLDMLVSLPGAEAEMPFGDLTRALAGAVGTLRRRVTA